MPELTWLDGYSGQTVDQLLALEATHRVDSLILAFEQAINQKSARVGMEALTPEERTVLAVEALEREVNNGGYHQFFVNTMEFAPLIVEVLRRIACPQTAAITEAAIQALRLPELSVAEIEKVIYDDDDERDNKLGECDDRYFEYAENIEGQLFAYTKTHKHSFTL